VSLALRKPHTTFRAEEGDWTFNPDPTIEGLYPTAMIKMTWVCSILQQLQFQVFYALLLVASLCKNYNWGGV